MKSMLMPAALALALAAWLTPAPVQAAGCLKGAAIGGVAGHFAGHHGLLGAGAGCIIGRHEANKHAREGADVAIACLRDTGANLMGTLRRVDLIELPFLARIPLSSRGRGRIGAGLRADLHRVGDDGNPDAASG